MNLRRTAAFTMVELVVSLGIGTLILVALVTGGVAFQKVFFAADDYYSATEDQNRVMDYIVRDLRRAGGGNVTTSGSTLQISYPDYIDYSVSASGTARTPTLTLTRPRFGMPTCSVAYTGTSVSATYTTTTTGGLTNITRSQVSSSGTSSATITYDRTAAYVLTDANPSGSGTSNFSFGAAGQPSSVKTTISFTPRFHLTNNAFGQAGSSIYSTTYLRKGTYDVLK